MKSPKPLLAIAAVLLALAAVFVWVVLFRGAPDEQIAGNVAEEPPTDRPGAAASATRDPAAPERHSETKRKVRRLRDKEQRRKLLEGIAAARALRREIARERRLAEGDEPVDEDAAGTLSKQTIRDAVDAVIEDVKSCYDEQLKLTPDLSGKLVVSFEIVAEEEIGGVVDRAEIGDESDETMRASEELTACIVDTIYTLELPEPEGGGVVKVSYPFVMRQAVAP